MKRFFFNDGRYLIPAALWKNSASGPFHADVLDSTPGKATKIAAARSCGSRFAQQERGGKGRRKSCLGLHPPLRRPMARAIMLPENSSGELCDLRTTQ